MTLKRYNNQHLIADLKKNLRFTRPAWISLIVISLLFTCSAVFISFTAPSEDHAFLLINASPYLQKLGFTFIINCIFSFGMVALLFSYLYKQKNFDLYHALPISRSTYIVSRFLTILLPMAFSYIVQFVLVALARVFFFKKFIVFSFSSLLSGQLVGFVAALAFTAVLIFCAVHATSLLKHLYYSVGITVLLPLGILLMLRLPQQHITGFAVNDTFVGYLFPLANGVLIVKHQGSFPMQALSMLAICALMLFLSAKIYTKSNRETMTSRTVMRAVQLGAQLFSLAFLSMLMHWTLLDTNNPLKALRAKPTLSILLGALLAFAVTALLEFLLTSKRNFKKAFVQVALVTGAAFCLAFGLQFAGPHYEDKMPAVEDIQSITFTDNVRGKNNANCQALRARFDAQQDPLNLLSIQDGVVLESQDSFQRVLALHEESVSFFQSKESHDEELSYTITYLLKNNKKITRTLFYSDKLAYFVLPWESFIAEFPLDDRLGEKYKAVVLSNEVLQNGSALFQRKAEDLLAFDFPLSTPTQVTDPVLLNQFLEALKKDLLSNPSLQNSASSLRYDTIYLYYKKPGTTPDERTFKYIDAFLNTSGLDGTSEFDYYFYRIDKRYENTMALFDDTENPDD